jgi:pimeloyl-ACP methyl ester carboxylesterase
MDPLLLTVPPTPRVPLPDTAFPRHQVDLYGTRMSFVDAGEGDPLVLLHGITCSAASWNALLPKLANATG